MEAASRAVSYAAGRNRDDLDDDELVRLALTKLVEIVGEAAKHVSNDLREVRSRRRMAGLVTARGGGETGAVIPP